jgi:hypothetical protein
LKQTETQQTTTYAAMGLAALIPGMQHMLVLMQAQLDGMRVQLAALQGGERIPSSNYFKAPGKIGRPPGAKNKPKADNSYWDSMTPEERSAEITRRMMVRRGEVQPTAHTAQVRARKAAAAEVDLDKLHPRDKRSPRHAAWLKKIQKVQKNAWAKLSPAERQERQDRMISGRNKAAGRKAA